MHERKDNRDRQCLGDCRNESNWARCNTLRRTRAQSHQGQATAHYIRANIVGGGALQRRSYTT